MLSTPAMQLLHVKHALTYLPILVHVFKNAGTVTWQFAMLSTPAMQLLHAKHELTCQPILVRVHLKMQVQ